MNGGHLAAALVILNFAQATGSLFFSIPIITNLQIVEITKVFNFISVCVIVSLGRGLG